MLFFSSEKCELRAVLAAKSSKEKQDLKLTLSETFKPTNNVYIYTIHFYAYVYKQLIFLVIAELHYFLAFLKSFGKVFFTW